MLVGAFTRLIRQEFISSSFSFLRLAFAQTRTNAPGTKPAVRRLATTRWAAISACVRQGSTLTPRPAAARMLMNAPWAVTPAATAVLTQMAGTCADAPGASTGQDKGGYSVGCED